MQELKYIVEEIHSVVVATVDENGDPVTCAIDIMGSDDDGLYFLTAKGKNFYGRLQRGTVAFTGMKGESTMSCVAVSVKGKVKELGGELISQLFEKNPYMYEIYPNEEARKSLTVFKIYEGSGEWFDLSKKPIERGTFSFGRTETTASGYEVTEKCIGCGSCIAVCPQNCIEMAQNKASIIKSHCLHCGSCMTHCPHDAIRKG